VVKRKTERTPRDGAPPACWRSWKTGIRFAGFPSSVEKLWAVPFLLFFEAVHGFSTERQRQ